MSDVISFIDSYKAGKTIGVEGRVVIVGAGNTGIDAAIAAILAYIFSVARGIGIRSSWLEL